MATNYLNTYEIYEAAAVFASSGFDADKVRPLMEMIEGQSDYDQKRFWALVDTMR